MTTIQLIFLLVLSGSVLHILYCIWRSYSALRWKVTEGRIVWSDVEEECDNDGCTLKPVVRYEYQVRGRDYLSERFAFGFMPSSFSFLAVGISNKFRINDKVPVFYNPVRPKDAVLIRGIKLFHLVNLLVLAVMIVMVLQYDEEPESSPSPSNGIEVETSIGFY